MIGRKEAIDQFTQYVAYDVESVESWDPSPWETDFEAILTRLMLHLEKAGGVEFAVLKDPKLGKWWVQKSKELERERKREAALEKLKATLSPEELEILRIKL
jgi:hypothetical protein